ncbi:BMP family ABC transporter substrate-binding protein [Kutzneria sp. 744]|uniref:BMP family ABC transporter substrate-binding protein n=1 Tax=Kutzneria sp. (strain 744) TaxID=345341 RepID=UPI0003EEBEA7|nr:BMP family ABC transporter substrate-binding protein [Kutzneria sp. 744]EWM19224.1 hypothetical protein KUTG_09528 [Kutzneria sp. 744]
MRRNRWLLIAAVVVATAGVGVALWLSFSDRELPPSRAVVYQDFQACLLTGPSGLASPAAQPVWAGLQDVSTQTRIKVSYLAMAEPNTAASDSPYVATLLQRRCNVVVTIDQAAATAANQVASQHPNVRFLVPEGSSTSTNVLPIPTKDQQAAVSRLVHDAIR